MLVIFLVFFVIASLCVLISISQNVVKYACTSDTLQTKTHCFKPHTTSKQNRKSETDTTPQTVAVSINVECEKLYSLHYVDRFYVGRVLEKYEKKENFYTMKFLHKATVGMVDKPCIDGTKQMILIMFMYQTSFLGQWHWKVYLSLQYLILKILILKFDSQNWNKKFLRIHSKDLH